VFFDRDGVVNKSPGEGFVERWEDFELLPEFVDVLRLVRGRGYEAVIVTNQSGVARGVMSAESVEEIHANLRQVLREAHALDLLDILVCPHLGDACDCRKPKPGMLLEAARRHGIDLPGSWMVGDQERDIEAGRRGGCRTILVSPGRPATDADLVVPSMTDLKRLIAETL
jgi:D-glycero-D-manno-heptose 1,7-bisphosphate phosphatase